jgi:hypothetical protein
VTVAGKPSDDLPTGTLHSIFTQPGYGCLAISLLITDKAILGMGLPSEE